MNDRAGPAKLDGAELVKRLGPHPCVRLGIPLRPGPERAASDTELWRWLVAAALLADRLGEERVATALRACDEAGLGAPAAWSAAGAPAAAASLARAGHRNAARRGAQLVRAAAALEARFGGSLTRLAEGATDLEELGARLAGLAPGIGPGTLRRFLEPLRDRFAAAAELPLAASTCAAARHLGLVAGSGGAEPEWSDLVRSCAAGPDPADLEAALGYLGERACRRGARARCPLGADCPGAEG